MPAPAKPADAEPPARAPPALVAPAASRPVGFSDNACSSARRATKWWCSPPRACRSTPHFSRARRRRAARYLAGRASGCAAGSVGASTSTCRPSSRRAPPADPDAVAASVLPATDNYVAFAPAGDRLIVQAGQFDAPFTLENRTSDAYTDFIERSMAARRWACRATRKSAPWCTGCWGRPLLLLGRRVQRRRPRVSQRRQPARWHRPHGADAAGRANARFAGWRLAARAGTGGTRWGRCSRRRRRPAACASSPPLGHRPGTPRTLEMREHGTMIAAAASSACRSGTRFGMRAEVV